MLLSQLASNVIGGLCHKLLEDVSRDVLPQAELLDQNRIVGRAFDHLQKAEIRNGGSAIAGHRNQDVAIAAGHQLVGYDFGKRAAFGDGQHMRLALGPDVLDQGLRVEPLAMLQDRPRHLDRVVEGQLVQGVEGRL